MVMKGSGLYITIAVLFSLLIVAPARAGGLILYELGTSDLGTADASTAALNPAGMTRLDRSQMLAAFQQLYVNARFDTDTASFGGGDGGNAGGFVSAGSVHYVHSLAPDWKLGISAGSYFGLGVDYGDDWAGRYYTTEAELLTFGINPSMGYRINDWLSVGGGFNIVYAELT
jgi:long-chain fatty acid transport protein